MAIRPELRDELLKLPTDQRQELADELYESLGDDVVDPAWEEAWSAEIVRRARELTRGEANLVDAEDVHAQLLAELRSRHT